MAGGAGRYGAGTQRSGVTMKQGVVAILLLAACTVEESGQALPAEEERRSDPAVAVALDRGLARIYARADSIDRVMHPLPLLRPAQEEAFRRFGNEQQLTAARRLGARPSSEAELERLQREGRLVPLPDTTERWIVRELDHSVALVTPDALALLERIGERFHGRLAGLGLPPYRLEVTSVLRSPASQAALRRVNPNAAAGVSTHEFGTTLDIAYSSFAAPVATTDWRSEDDPEWLEPRLQRIAASVLETVAARRSRELQAVLGQVLAELQSAGDVMVTLERLQPVYHLTVARALAGS
jgi:hypothetical protein